MNPMNANLKYPKESAHDRMMTAWYEELSLPVAPICNYMCNFCTKACDCICNGNSPEQLSKAMTPRQAVNFSKESSKRNIRIKQFKISGPGEPLANNQTFEVLKRLNQMLPDYEYVISTNGLLLYDKVALLKEYNVSEVNVSFNAIHAETLKKLISRIVLGDDVIMDSEKMLNLMLHGQIDGIKRCLEEGIVVNVNTIFFPGINDADVLTIAALCRKLKVNTMNFISCYPNGKLKNLKVPSLYEMADMKVELTKSVRIVKIETFSPSLT